MRFTAVFLLAFPAAALAQAPAARVEIDHVSGDTRLIVQRGASADTTALGRDRVVRLHRDVPVDVQVVNTNTALYEFGSAAEDVALPEVETLQAFSARLTPYVPELRAALARGGGAKGAEDAAPTEQALSAARLALAVALGSTERGLVGVDQALFGENGLQPTMTASLLALEQMRRGVPPEQASEPLRRALGLGGACGSQVPVRLPTAELLLTSLSRLAAGSQELRGAMYGSSFAGDARWVALRDSARTLEARAHAALGDFEPLVANAYRVERLVGLVANACSRWSAGEARGSLTKGRSITITVRPRPEPELSRLAERGADQYTVLVQPRALVRPAIAVGAIAAPGGRFPTYATRPVAGGVEVYESGRKDRRFGIGGTLGFTWAMLDQSDARGFALWLPEILVAAGDLTGAGVGAGVSVGFVKLGAGAMWMRHESLSGARAGDVVADESQVQLVDGYGKPKLYFSLSIFDWSPLAKRIPGG